MRTLRASASKGGLGPAWPWALAALWAVILAGGGVAGAGSPTTTPTAAASEPTTICVSYILIHYWGSHGATEVRPVSDAAAIAREALARIRQPGANFKGVARELAEKYPDVRLLDAGPISRAGNQPPEVLDVAFRLREGEIADGFTSSAFGLHIIRRNPAVRCRHILVAYQGASRAIAKRSRDEALGLAEKIRRQALVSGADFAQLARKYSDAPDGGRGGDIGFFDEGMTVAAFEKAAFALPVGQVSPVIETRFGFHIIARIE